MLETNNIDIYKTVLELHNTAIADRVDSILTNLNSLNRLEGLNIELTDYLSNIKDDPEVVKYNVNNMITSHSIDVLHELGIILDSTLITYRDLDDIFTTIINLTRYNNILSSDALDILDTDEMDNISKFGNLVELYTSNTALDIHGYTTMVTDETLSNFKHVIESVINNVVDDTDQLVELTSMIAEVNRELLRTQLIRYMLSTQSYDVDLKTGVNLIHSFAEQIESKEEINNNIVALLVVTKPDFDPIELEEFVDYAFSDIADTQAVVDTVLYYKR